MVMTKMFGQFIKNGSISETKYHRAILIADLKRASLERVLLRCLSDPDKNFKIMKMANLKNRV